MDGSGISSIVALIVLIAFHAWMVFSYAVLTNFRRTPLNERSEAGDKRAKRALRLSQDLTRLHLTNQLVLMLTRFAIVALAVVALADPLVASTPDVTDLGSIAIYAAVLLPVALLTYIFGDLIPAAFGQLYADQALQPVVNVTRFLVVVFTPLVFLLMRLSGLVTRLSGAESLSKAVTEEEIMTLVDSGEKSGAIEDEEKEMIYSVLQFGETLAREVMVPRPDISAVPQDATLQDALKTIVETGHSRIPVYDESIDDIKGLLYAKDILTFWQRGQIDQTSVKALLRPAYFVPETKRADMLFREMQAAKSHIAIVVDEYGGTAGIVTIEDLLEEIVGDIRDEYDQNEVAEVIPLGESAYDIDASMNLDDLNELLEADLPTDDNDSVGGYVYSALGRVPEVGDHVDVPEQNLRLTVESLDNRRIIRVRVERVTPPPEPAPDESRTPTKPLPRVSRDQARAASDDSQQAS